MRLNHALHLAYCMNVHRGETWRETFDSLKTHALAVRERVCPHAPFAIGLRLSHRAARELSERDTLLEFQRWLEQNDCYVFTINGFPYGQFHGTRVKEQVYRPDWTSPERLAYTNLLFDLLAEILPAGVEGSVSSLPGSFKEFVAPTSRRCVSAQRPAFEKLTGETPVLLLKIIRENLWRCVEHIAELSERAKCQLHLGLEPEPLCLLENTAETIRFFDQMRGEHPGDPRLAEHLGVNYDTCHFAVEFEQPQKALTTFAQAGIKISKIHLSSALKAQPTPEAREALAKFADDVYLHQVAAHEATGKLKFYRDLSDALSCHPPPVTCHSEEWRIHFHVPLHARASPPFDNTNDHLLGTLDFLAANPKLCSHLEMETYTWEVLPPELKARSVVEQLAAEYDWTLARLKERGLF